MPTETIRLCSKCGQAKPSSDFLRRNDNRLYRPECKACFAAYMRAYRSNPDNAARDRARAAARHEQFPEERKRTKLRLSFGITLEEYREMEAAQGGLCAICGQPEPSFDKRTGRRRDLAVDHDHKTGKVRGLLCGHCNRAIGLVAESSVVLARMILYLSPDS